MNHAITIGGMLLTIGASGVAAGAFIYSGTRDNGDTFAKQRLIGTGYGLLIGGCVVGLLCIAGLVL